MPAPSAEKPVTLPPGRVRALTFDLDDTLWETWPTIERAERRLHDWLTERYPAITERYDTVQLRELRTRVRAERPEIAHNLSLLRQEGLRLAALQVGIAAGDFDAEAAFAVFHSARNDVLFFADAVPALERLTRRYTLGALSNGNADIHLVGIGHLFDFALSAADVGRPKPAPDMFHAALERLGAPDPGQVVHVGDDPETDIRGAAEAGLRTVWVNRGGADWAQFDQPCRPDAEVRTLSELETLLRRWHAVG